MYKRPLTTHNKNTVKALHACVCVSVICCRPRVGFRSEILRYIYICIFIKNILNQMSKTNNENKKKIYSLTIRFKDNAYNFNHR